MPLRQLIAAALAVAHGDRRMRGSNQLDTRANAEGSTATNGSLGNWSRCRQERKAGMQIDLGSGNTARVRSRAVAVLNKSRGLPWPGVPP